jgi:hypothetical protein
MNLTKWFAAGLCITAMTVSAQSIKTNSFETGDSGEGWFVGVDKSFASSTILVANDATNARDTYSNDATNRPMPDAANTKVLKLDESVTFTNEITDASFLSNPVYVDMLVKFVPSDTLAPVDGAIKMAIAVTNNLLAVTRYNGGDNEWVITDTIIDTSVWHRVTVKLELQAPANRMATVTIDQNTVMVGGVSPFRITDNEGSVTLKALSFSGTGYVDEIVVTRDNPFSSLVAFGGGANQVDPQELQIWKTAHNSGATEVANQYNAFLMNVNSDPTWGSPKLVVDSILVDGTVTVTIKALYANDAKADLGAPLNNGALLNVWGKVDIATGSWVRIGSDLSFTPGTYQFFAVTVGPIDVPPAI